MRSGARQKAGVKDEPPAKRRIRLGKLWWWIVAVFAALIGWQMWELHLYNAAVREAKEAGFLWKCEGTLSLIRQDWRNALKKATWGKHPRDLLMREVRDLGRYRELLLRLRPTDLHVNGCESVDALKGLTELQTLDLFDIFHLQNVDALKSLSGLQSLGLFGCSKLKNVDGLKDLASLQTLVLTKYPALQNVDFLKGFSGLRNLRLSDCKGLQNVDGLKGLTGLQDLNLGGCSRLQNVDGLKGLAGLERLSLRVCDGLHNIDVLKGLAGLRYLDLTGIAGLKQEDGPMGNPDWTGRLSESKNIPAAALRELRAALPNTDITFPDGTKNPPQ